MADEEEYVFVHIPAEGEPVLAKTTTAVGTAGDPERVRHLTELIGSNDWHHVQLVFNPPGMDPLPAGYLYMVVDDSWNATKKPINTLASNLLTKMKGWPHNAVNGNVLLIWGGPNGESGSIPDVMLRMIERDMGIKLNTP